jgi:NAD(P)H-dependent FMN reductase
MPTPLHVLVLAGSPRRRSYTRGLARHIGEVLRRDGARVSLLDLHETPLPPLDPDLRGGTRPHPDAGVAELLRRAAAADAYVLASPTYHNSYAGVLKNALDYLSIHDFRYRPVGLAAHGGRSTQAVDHLRQVVRGVLGVSIPTQVCTRVSDYADEPGASGFYEIIDREILERIERFASELLLFAQHLRGLRADPVAGPPP